jgi:hypothetical protein
MRAGTREKKDDRRIQRSFGESANVQEETAARRKGNLEEKRYFPLQLF